MNRVMTTVEHLFNMTYNKQINFEICFFFQIQFSVSRQILKNRCNDFLTFSKHYNDSIKNVC